MDCREIQERLSAFLDREVGQDLHLQMSSHLATCPACQAELAALERLDAALASLEAPAPRDLAAKVRRRLHSPAIPWFQSLALAVCLVLGIFLGSSLTGSLYPASANGITSEVANLEVFQDSPQGSLGGAFSYQGEEDSSA